MLVIPMSSPKMTRMFGLVVCAEELAAAASAKVNKISVFFIFASIPGGSAGGVRVHSRQLLTQVLKNLPDNRQKTTHKLSYSPRPSTRRGSATRSLTEDYAAIGLGKLLDLGPAGGALFNALSWSASEVNAPKNETLMSGRRSPPPMKMCAMVGPGGRRSGRHLLFCETKSG